MLTTTRTSTTTNKFMHMHLARNCQVARVILYWGRDFKNRSIERYKLGNDG
jgi:hypothetical protein